MHGTCSPELSVQIVKYFRQIQFLLLLGIITFSACVDDNYNDIDTSLIYDAEASLPLGNTNPMLSEILDTIDLIPIPDWVDKDKASFFLYDSVYYYSPGRIKVSTSGYFSLDPFQNDTIEITSLMFRTNAINGIPAEIDLQLYFTDSTGSVIDSLYSTGPLRIEPAVVDSVGNVTATYEIWELDNYFSDDKIDSISNSQYIEVKAEVIIPDSSQGTIAFTSSQEIWIQVGIWVGFKIVISDGN
ncbi:MAG: hypothetical protein QNK30_14895 [Bacteroidales bacterium]|nr:hypothetical protein [Bacteroidales bacterium]